MLAQDALDSIEFMAGSANSTWGSKRADMGRAQPWNLTYMAIGNEVHCHPPLPLSQIVGKQLCVRRDSGTDWSKSHVPQAKTQLALRICWAFLHVSPVSLRHTMRIC